jgi:hypothetical protein
MGARDRSDGWMPREPHSQVLDIHSDGHGHYRVECCLALCSGDNLQLIEDQSHTLCVRKKTNDTVVSIVDDRMHDHCLSGCSGMGSLLHCTPEQQ